MSCFKHPKGLVKELEILIRKFWLGYNGDNRKVHWVKRDRLCEAKEVGVLGFKEIEKFNDSLLAKQVWRMINNPNSLCHRVFKARFFPNCSILEAKDSTVSSYAWKSILSARDVICKSVVWRIRNGQSMRIKKDNWLPVKSHRKVISPLTTIEPETKVSSLINHELGVWKAEIVERLFLPHEAAVILGIPLSNRLPYDNISWGLTPNGDFSTKSAYNLIVALDNNGVAGSSNFDSQCKFWKKLWSLKMPNKVKHFAWRACNNALPTMVNLAHRNISSSNVCELCKTAPEDTLHALWACSKLEVVWNMLS